MRTIRARAIPVALIAAAVVVIAACTPPPAGGGDPGTTTTAPSNDPRHCPARGAGEARVAIVVEFGPLAGGTSVTCVVVGPGASGVTALTARAARLGTPAPRYNASGLLCAIDGKPVAPACGSPSSGGFDYWSYWIGGTSWTYATVGPASRAMLDSTVEGWRFVSGGANVAPASSPSFATLTS
jgi:hypothetical protein